MSNLILSLATISARFLPMSMKRAIYRFKPLAGFIRNELNRAVPEGFTQVNVAAGGLAGMRMSLDLQAEKDYWLGTYELELQATIEDLVEPGAVVYDIGANIGYITLLLSQIVGESGQVFAFEALPANLDRLRENIYLNGLESRVFVVPGAVADRSKPVRFLIGPSGGVGKVEGSAGRQELTYTESITVPGIVLDEFVFTGGNPVPQVVKIDIEGGEVIALKGMRRLLAEASPLVFLEIHGPEAARVAWDALKSAGYSICDMRTNYPIIKSVGVLDWKAYLVGMPGK